EAGYASYDEKTFSGYLSGPISDRFRVSLVGYSRTTDNYLDLADQSGRRTNRPAAPGKNQSIRAKLEADITDNLTVELGYNFAYVNGPRAMMFTPVGRIPTSGPTAIPPSALPLTRDPDVKVYNSGTRYQDKLHQGTIVAALDTGIGTLKARGAYDRSTLD